jgi:hypothetical protein
MVIVAVPAAAAQEVVDRVVAGGVRGILNFAPVKLRVPAGVVLKNVNMVMELEALSFALANGGLPAGRGMESPRTCEDEAGSCDDGTGACGDGTK